MGETKHTAGTPGPWAVNEERCSVESQHDHGWVNDGWVICVTEGPDRKANARLIAAAPDLLAELKAMLEMFEARPDMMRALRPLMGPAEIVTFDAARAAIAKAEASSHA